MGTVTEKLEKVLDTKAAIRDAIIGKGQAIADADPFSSYAAKITAIQTGADTSDATATASDILSGKTAYAKGAKVTGNIASKTASNVTVIEPTVIVSAGYYPSQVSKSITTATQAIPSISVDSGGQIVASATQSTGYVFGGTTQATQQLTTQAATTITPGTTEKTAVAAGRYTTGEVKVSGDANLVAENIKSGVSIFGVEGTLSTNEEGCLYFSNLGVRAGDLFVFEIDKSSEQGTKFLSLWNMDKVRKIIIFSSIPSGTLSDNSGAATTFWGLNAELDIPSKSNISGLIFGIRKSGITMQARNSTDDNIPAAALIRDKDDYVMLDLSSSGIGTGARAYPTATYNAIIIHG